MKRRLIQLFLAVVAGSLAAGAQTFLVDCYRCDVNDDGTTVTIYRNTANLPSGDVVIPSTVTNDGVDYQVTAIGGSAFTNCAIESVVIPDCVTTVGRYAFYNCSAMKSAVIGAGVTSLGNYPFYGTSLESVTWNAKNCESPANSSACPFYGVNTITSFVIGDEVESIPKYLCYAMQRLTSIDIPASVKSIGGAAFYGCDRLTQVNISDLAGWCGIEFGSPEANPLSQAHHLFVNGTEKKNLLIPIAVTSISPYAFYGCTGLTALGIRKSVVSIAASAFRGCSGLEEIIVEESNSVYDSRNNCNALIETATHTLLVGCNYTVIPHTVTTIGPNAFLDCTGLTSMTIPASVTSINKSSFWGCVNLEEITVERENPMYDSRMNCNAIIERATKTLLIGCKGSTIPSTVTAIGDDAFYGCVGLTSIDIPNSVTTIGQSAFQNCMGLTSIVIPNSVTTMGKYAFQYCTELEDVTISNQLETLDTQAFLHCLKLTNVDIPASVKNIGYLTFSECYGLERINIPATLTTLGSGAFQLCRSLQEINLPGVTSIGGSAFYGCDVMARVKIGKSLATLDDWAFENCTALETFTIKSDPAEITYGEGIFDGVFETATPTLRVPQRHLEAYRATAPWTLFNTIEPIIVGDVNGDNLTSGADVTALYGVLLDDNEVDGDADVNEDGVVSGGDVTALYNILLN